MVDVGDFEQIVSDKYKPIVRFMFVLIALVVFIAFWIVRGYNVYLAQNDQIDELRREVEMNKAAIERARKQRGKMIQNEILSLKAARELHDLNGDMAQDKFTSRRKDHYRSRRKGHRSAEQDAILSAALVTQD